MGNNLVNMLAIAPAIVSTPDTVTPTELGGHTTGSFNIFS